MKDLTFTITARLIKVDKINRVTLITQDDQNTDDLDIIDDFLTDSPKECQVPIWLDVRASYKMLFRILGKTKPVPTELIGEMVDVTFSAIKYKNNGDNPDIWWFELLTIKAHKEEVYC